MTDNDSSNDRTSNQEEKKTFFKNIEVFYNDDLEGRRHSREADYGVNWKVAATGWQP